MIKQIKNKIEGIRNLIGNTPLLEIKLKYKGEERTIFAKAEHYNLTGVNGKYFSIKNGK